MAKGASKLPSVDPSKLQQGQGRWSRRNFAPVLLLSIGGKKADDLLRLCTHFSYKRTLLKATETKFVFRNDDRKLVDDERLFPNTLWQFRFGYFNDMSPIISGYIRLVEPVYDMKRTVSITLYDSALDLSTTSSGKNWGKVQSSDIAKAIAKKYGLKFVGEPSKDIQKKSWIQPNSVNDLQFLHDLSVMVDFEVFVSDSPPTLFYRKKKYDDTPRARLVYYDEPGEFSYVKRFAPKVKSLGPLVSAASGADSGKGNGQKTQAQQKDSALANRQVQLSGVAAIATVVKKDVSVPVPHDVKKQQLVEAARQQMLDKTNEATSDHPLTPSIDCGFIYEWAGIEQQINGKWYCTEVNHTIDGHTAETKATWKRNATGKGTGDKMANKNNKSVSSSPPVVQLAGVNGNATVIPGNPAAPAPRQ